MGKAIGSSVILLWAVVMLSAGAARAEERITRFDSEIEVAADGSMVVMETIAVEAEGRQICHGIYRDFPTQYTRPGKTTRVVTPFDVLGVSRDGQGESFRIENSTNSKRVYIGDAKRYVSPGPHVYVLKYRTGRQLGFFEKYDQLYWNVTGNEWAFTIEEATARVSLPPGAKALGQEAYTGPRGAKGQQYTSDVDAAGRAEFRTTRPLRPGEGLTIVVNFPKGMVAPPTEGQELTWLLKDNAAMMAAYVGGAAVLLYFAAAWVRVGRDPAKGTIIPLFEPPQDLCPAAVRYVSQMRFDAECVTANVVDLAVRKYWKIKEVFGQYSLARYDDSGYDKLPESERMIGRALLRDYDSIEVDSKNHEYFSTASKELKRYLAQRFQKRLFFPNTGYFAVGAGLTLATFAAMAALEGLMGEDPAIPFLAVWLTGWSAACLFLLQKLVTSWRRARHAGSGAAALTNKLGVVGPTVFTLAFFVPEVVAIGILVHITSLWLILPVVALAAANAGFYYLLKRPTVEGRRVMDAIEGFKMYLETAEPAANSEPAVTPETFERLLPYAIALGVAGAWGAKFAAALAAGTAGAAAYTPVWYSGGTLGDFNTSGFASSLGSSFSGAVASAGAAPGSSDGSGGGGSSGGGGGGGGGGGW